MTGVLAGATYAAGAEATAADAQKDPVLKAMLAELDRSKQQLQLQNMQRPFFIEYRIDDVTSFAAEARYGSLTEKEDQHQRVARVVVMVGDYKTDSFSGRGDGSVELTAIDNDAEAIRYALWSATDSAYKAALDSYVRKQAALKRFENVPQSEDFSQEKPVVVLEPTAELKIDREAWEKRIAEASGLYASDPAVSEFSRDVQVSEATVRGEAVNRFLVNSEGTIVRKGRALYRVSMNAETQAADGMPLDRGYGDSANSAEKLLTAEKFKERSEGVLKTLRDLKNAPVVAEEYHGPVLFAGHPSAEVFRRLFVSNIEAQKPEMGTNARTRGAYASSYHSRVLPDFLTVIDDPSLKTFNRHDLLGTYTVDDEGVLAQPVTVVEKGKLDNYLIGRRPIKDFPNSNGHGRAAIARAAEPSIGVLQVKAAETTPVAELHAKLLALGKDQERQSVYEVDNVGGELVPKLLYRVNVADGKRELVRGAVFDELDQRSLRSDIVAAGDDPFVENGAGNVPETIIAPSLLFGDIGVKRANEEHEKLPYYPPPPSGN